MNSNLSALPSTIIHLHTEAHSRLAQELLIQYGGQWAVNGATYLPDVWDSYGSRGVIHVREGRLTYGGRDHGSPNPTDEIVNCNDPGQTFTDLEKLLRLHRPATFFPESASMELVGRLATALGVEGFTTGWGNDHRLPVLDWGSRVSFFRDGAKSVSSGPAGSHRFGGPVFFGAASLEAFIAYITGRTDAVPPPPAPPAWTDDQVAAALGASAAALVRTLPGERIVRGTLRALFPGLIPPIEAVTTAAIYDWLRVVLPPRMAVPAPAERISLSPRNRTVSDYTLVVEYTCTEHGRSSYSEDREGSAHLEISHSDLADLAAEAADEDDFVNALVVFAEEAVMDSPPDTDSGDRDYDDDEYEDTTDASADAPTSRCRAIVQAFLEANPTLAPGYQEPEEEEEEEEEEAAAPTV